MFDYLKLNTLAAQDKGIASILDDLFSLARSTYPSLSRFSVALVGDNKASNYYVSDLLSDCSVYDYSEQELQSHSALARISVTQSVRVIDDLALITPTQRLKRLLQRGHKSSYTSPISYKDVNLGFVFLNASQTAFFHSQEVQRDMAFFTQTISNLFIQQHASQRHFQSSLNVALNMGHARDPETAEHLVRMGKYSELLARLLSAQKSEITHQFVHRIRLYAPFHDIGKYRIPDDVLFSTKRFTPSERNIMNMHTIYGEEMINDVVSISDSNAISDEEIQFIKNIIRHHHERFDGKGLPDSLSYENIPLEARIVTLADVFDALLSQRAYKQAWPTSKVMNYVEENSGLLFDPDCVKALQDNLPMFLDIRSQYLDAEDKPDSMAC